MHVAVHTAAAHTGMYGNLREALDAQEISVVFLWGAALASLMLACDRWAALVAPRGQLPPARDTFAAPVLPSEALMLIFGGDSGGSGYLADLWALCSTWTQLRVRACVPAVGRP